MVALTLLLAATPAPVLAEVDTLWRDRTPANYRANAQKVIDRLKPHAKQFEAAWRLARAYVWLSERKPYHQDGAYKARLGQQAMRHAQTAIKLKPERVEGQGTHPPLPWRLLLQVKDPCQRRDVGTCTGEEQDRSAGLLDQGDRPIGVGARKAA